jgi:hypothetical protein
MEWMEWMVGDLSDGKKLIFSLSPNRADWRNRSR